MIGDGWGDLGGDPPRARRSCTAGPSFTRQHARGPARRVNERLRASRPSRHSSALPWPGGTGGAVLPSPDPCTQRHTSASHCACVPRPPPGCLNVPNIRKIDLLGTAVKYSLCRMSPRISLSSLLCLIISFNSSRLRYSPTARERTRRGCPARACSSAARRRSKQQRVRRPPCTPRARAAPIRAR